MSKPSGHQVFKIPVSASEGKIGERRENSRAEGR